MATSTANAVLAWGFDHDEDFDFDFEWDYLTEELDVIISRINPKGNWHCEVKNFGWRKLSGEKDFTAVTGQKLLSSVLPKTYNNFHIYVEGDTININNFHHDSPCGDEWYTLTPA